MPIRGPKVKVSRSLNMALTEKAARIMEKRGFGPGQHGSGRRRSPSVYKTQLVEKQRLKFTYNISESHLRAAYARAAAMPGATGSNILVLLEERLDAIILRMGFAKTAYAARQYCAHGHFTINGQRNFNGSARLRVGDVVAVREKSKNHPQILEAINNAPDAPSYLEVTKAKLEGKLVAVPERDLIPVNINEQLVVEFYSR